MRTAEIIISIATVLFLVIMTAAVITFCVWKMFFKHKECQKREKKVTDVSKKVESEPKEDSQDDQENTTDTKQLSASVTVDNPDVNITMDETEEEDVIIVFGEQVDDKDTETVLSNTTEQSEAVSVLTETVIDIKTPDEVFVVIEELSDSEESTKHSEDSDSPSTDVKKENPVKEDASTENVLSSIDENPVGKKESSTDNSISSSDNLVEKKENLAKEEASAESVLSSTDENPVEKKESSTENSISSECFTEQDFSEEDHSSFLASWKLKHELLLQPSFLENLSKLSDSQDEKTNASPQMDYSSETLEDSLEKKVEQQMQENIINNLQTIRQSMRKPVKDEKCPNCPKHFANTNGVRAHWFSVHKTDPREESFAPPLMSTQKVNQSETTSAFSRSKSKRKSVKHIDKKFVCPHCPKRCETKNGLKHHFSSIHNITYVEDEESK